MNPPRIHDRLDPEVLAALRDAGRRQRVAEDDQESDRPHPRFWASVTDDGRDTIWGSGETPELALQDLRRSLGDLADWSSSDLLADWSAFIRPITAEERAAIGLRGGTYPAVGAQSAAGQFDSVLAISFKAFLVGLVAAVCGVACWTLGEARAYRAYEEERRVLMQEVERLRSVP